MSTKAKQRSAVKHIRSSYLFFGLYLIAKFDFKARWENDDAKYLRAFERMRDYFTKKFEEYSSKINVILVDPVQFNHSFQNFCESNSAILGSESPAELPNMQDWLSYDLHWDSDHTPQQHKKHYWKMVKERIEKSPNPFLDKGLFDFIQLLQINYTLTQDEKLRKWLEEMGRKVFTRHIPWRFDSRVNPSNLKWPNFHIYKDQDAFLLIINNSALTYEALEILYLNKKIGDNSSEEDYEQGHNWFHAFRYDIYPIYYWFFILLLGKHDWNDSDIERIKYWLYLINESIYLATNVFGNRYPIKTHKGIDSPKIDLNEDVLGAYGWNTVDNLPELPF